MQRDSLDEETRNRLWTLMKLYVWDKWESNVQYDPHNGAVKKLLNNLWFNYFKKPIDIQPPMYHTNNRDSFYNLLRSVVMGDNWNEVFDLIEFVLANLPEYITGDLCTEINRVFAQENSSYRLVGGQFVEITNDSEIAEVDAAAQTGLDGVSAHIAAAVKFLSDRKNPNYRNSVKESISAVESLFKVLTKNESATLSDGLKEMKKTNEIHPSLLLGFEKIYAYTSDQGGIRHAIFDTDKTSHSDAKFMLVSCSAFINYVVGKWAESGKKIK